MHQANSKTIRIFDTTLRDGEQTPGVSFTVEAKVEIAKALERLGVDAIEAGFPIVSEGELEAVRKGHRRTYFLRRCPCTPLHRDLRSSLKVQAQNQPGGRTRFGNKWRGVCESSRYQSRILG